MTRVLSFGRKKKAAVPAGGSPAEASGGELAAGAAAGAAEGATGAPARAPAGAPAGAPAQESAAKRGGAVGLLRKLSFSRKSRIKA